MKHIYKYSLESAFFKITTSDTPITKEIIEGKPAISWQEDENTVCSWVYELTEEGETQRDNDYQEVMSAYHLLKLPSVTIEG